jgi:hypothetical protein
VAIRNRRFPKATGVIHAETVTPGFPESFDGKHESYQRVSLVLSWLRENPTLKR